MSVYAADPSLKLLQAESRLTLQKVQQALLNYLDDPEEAASLVPLAELAELAEQVRSLFTRLDQPDAVTLMEETQALARSLGQQQVADPAAAREALSQAILQAPRYLNGEQDSQRLPSLFPLINLLRRARGCEPLPPAVSLHTLATRLRPVLQRALLGVLRGRSRDDSLSQASAIFIQLKQAAPDEAVYRLWWLAEGLAAVVQTRDTAPDPQLNLLLRDLDRQVKVLIETTEIDYAHDEVVHDLERRLTAYLASDQHGTAWLADTAQYLPPRPPLAVESAPPDPETLHKIAICTREWLALVRNTVERHVRDGSHSDALTTEVGRLHGVVNVLDLLDATLLADTLRQHETLCRQWLATPAALVPAQAIRLVDELRLVERSLEHIDRFAYNATPTVTEQAERIALLQDLCGWQPAPSEPEPEPEPAPEPEPEPVIAAAPPVPAAPPARPAPAIDPEFLEIFFEEAQGELESISEQLGQWRANIADHEALTTIRRSFHTLKGSGRMVGLSEIGDFAWNFEQLLNRIIDGTLFVAPSVLNAVDAAQAVLRAPIGAQRLPDAAETVAMATLAQHAQALLRGEQPKQEPEPELEPELEPEPTAFEDIADPAPAPVVIAAPEPEAPVAYSAATVVPAELDPELLDVFLYEAAEILDESDARLERLRSQPDDEELLHELRRAMHTLKGSSRMCGLTVIGDLGHAVETLLEGMGKDSAAASAAILDVLQHTLDRLNDMLSRVKRQEPIIPAIDLIERVATLRGLPFTRTASVPAPTVPPVAAVPAVVGEPDRELIEVFLYEAVEILDASDVTLQRWSADRDNDELLNDLRREMHTLKGSSRMAGLGAIGDLGHAMESMLESIGKRKVDPAAAPIPLLQRTLDTLNDMLSRVKVGGDLEPADDLINEFHSLLGLEPVRSTLPTAPAKPAAAPKKVEKSARRGGRRTATTGSDTDTIRVNAHLINNLINQMGESSIYRARVDQGVSSFRFNLGELDQTVSRLRQHLRRLEIETEAQILFRYEAGPKRGHVEEFDPLELDRFSELQQLSRQLMEVVEDLSNLRNTLDDQAHNMGFLLDQQAKVNKELQQGLMQTRMVRFSSVVPRLRRVVRQVANDEGKRAELVITGSESEVDRSVLENMVAPLEHMLRNAIFHGLEAPEQRRALGKPDVGQIALDLRREGAELVLRLSDDGAGLNYKAIREKALERGDIQPNQPVTEQELIALILKPGFSVAKKVSMVAGRGVGMDVLNEAIRAMRGALQIESREGKGSLFTIRLPFSLAVTQALLIQAGGDTYAVPLLSVEAVARLQEGEFRAYLDGKAVQTTYGERRYPLHGLGVLFGSDDAVKRYDDTTDTRPPALLFRSAEASAALQVDAVIGNQEIIVKPVGPQLHTVPGISGATVLGDGRVVIVLDLAALVRSLTTQSQKQAEAEAIRAVQRGTEQEKLTAMVIDDSITMRKVLARFLERQGFSVTTAKDGIEAIALLEEKLPHIAFLDIEMPRMDGFEVMAHVRNQPHLKRLPVIMVTSRSGDKHRDRGAKLGVNDYLIKPYQEEEMLKSIRRVLGDQGMSLPG